MKLSSILTKYSRNFNKKQHPVREKLASIEHLLQNQEYAQAFQLCQESFYPKNKQSPKLPKIPVDIGQKIFYAGAWALFGLGHIHQAEQWIEKYKDDVQPQTNHLYLIAYLALHHNRPEEALLHWTSILQRDPAQTFADKLITRLKDKDKQSLLTELSNPHYLPRYIPLEPIGLQSKLKSEDIPEGTLKQSYAKNKNLNYQESLYRSNKKKKRQNWESLSHDPFWKVIGFGVIFSLFLISGGVLYFGDWQPSTLLSSFFYYQDRLELPAAPTSGTVIAADQYSSQKPRFIYTDRDSLISIYNTALKKIYQGKVNQARGLLGRLELSNASFEIKERVLLLRNSIPTVGFNDFHDPINIEKITEEAYIYRDAQVLWQGTLKLIRPGTKDVLELEVQPQEKQNQGFRLLIRYPAQTSQIERLLTNIRATGTQNVIQVFGNIDSIKAGHINITAQKLLFPTRR